MHKNKSNFQLNQRLLAALAESKEDLRNSRYHEDSVEEHLKRIFERL